MNDASTKFNTCLKAVDCNMEHQMRVTPHSTSRIATFMQQMIPHHVNAVNMAKALLKDGEALNDADITNLILNIINTQNYQIMQMTHQLHHNMIPHQASSVCAEEEKTSYKYF